VPAQVTTSRGGVTRSSHTPPLVEEAAPFPDTQMVLERTKIWSPVPTGPKTKNNCAGEAGNNLLLRYAMARVKGETYCRIITIGGRYGRMMLKPN
jgi:hypothetical protein